MVYDITGNPAVDESGATTDEVIPTYPQEVGFRKSQQMVTIRWTPKLAVPRQGGGSYFPANTERVGMLYSDVYGTNKIVGYDVSVKTFMTAVNNPYSLLYTENANPSHSQSAYGVTYTYGDHNTGAYFGSACNHFAMYCIGSPISYSSHDMINGKYNGEFDKVYNQSATGLEVMDVLAKSGHVMLVTRLWGNGRGVITKVQLSEQVGDGAVNNAVRTASEFDAFIAEQGYRVFRYKYLYKNIKYDASPFVAVEDETIVPYVYNDDICTFAGDYACFAEGDLLHVNYTKGNYTQMEIYKDDVLLETITLDASADIHDVDLTAKNYTYGKYKARLKNGDEYSDYTFWEIVNASASLTESNLTFSSANGRGIWWGWINSKGYPKYKYHVAEQASSGVIDVGERDANYSQLKIVFEGDYGRIARIAT